MRRQRTEVVVELRKVNRFGALIAFCLWGGATTKRHARAVARTTVLILIYLYRTKETNTF